MGNSRKKTCMYVYDGKRTVYPYAQHKKFSFHFNSGNLYC